MDKATRENLSTSDHSCNHNPILIHYASPGACITCTYRYLCVIWLSRKLRDELWAATLIVMNFEDQRSPIMHSPRSCWVIGTTRRHDQCHMGLTGMADLGGLSITMTPGLGNPRSRSSVSQHSGLGSWGQEASHPVVATSLGEPVDIQPQLCEGLELVHWQLGASSPAAIFRIHD